MVRRFTWMAPALLIAGFTVWAAADGPVRSAARRPDPRGDALVAVSDCLRRYIEEIEALYQQRLDAVWPELRRRHAGAGTPEEVDRAIAADPERIALDEFARGATLLLKLGGLWATEVRSAGERLRAASSEDEAIAIRIAHAHSWREMTPKIREGVASFERVLVEHGLAPPASGAALVRAVDAVDL